MCPKQTQSFCYKKDGLRLELVINGIFSVRERPQVMHQRCSQNTVVFIIEKKFLLICILINALPHFVESLNTTGITGRENFNRQEN